MPTKLPAPNKPRINRNAGRLWHRVLLAFSLLPATILAQVQPPTLGLQVNEPTVYPGYVLVAPNVSTKTYLINHEGKIVNRWSSAYLPGVSSYLLENGNLLRTANLSNTTFNAGGSGGRLEEYDWEGNLVWSFNYSTPQYCQHHDALKLPNGNYLLVAWELKTKAESIAAGRDPSLVTSAGLWPETIIEVQPTLPSGGTIVWEWKAWDHMIQDFDNTKANFGVVANHPELIDINQPGTSSADWIHCNGIDYNAELDQILISAPEFNEIWIIDHSTTTGEAAGSTGGSSGKGGDLLYRWGNPLTYGAGTANDQQLFFQHHPNWIKPGLPGAGNILIFNNRQEDEDGRFSTVNEIVPPVDINGNYSLLSGPSSSYGPLGSLWTYTATPPNSFYAGFISGAQRQPNGNTLICRGPQGILFEVNPAGDTVWKYVSPVAAAGPLDQGSPALSNAVFRAPSYAPDYPGLAGRDLTHWGTIEIYPEATFKIIAVTKAVPGLRLRWNSSPDVVYTIEYQASLASGTWIQIGTVTALGTEAFFSDPDLSRASLSKGFYRVTQP